MSQLAVGAGVGLRVDVSFLVLRLDVAFPLRKPWLPDGQRWVIDQIDFGSGTWRKNNLVLNIAIGYPFSAYIRGWFISYHALNDQLHSGTLFNACKQ